MIRAKPAVGFAERAALPWGEVMIGTIKGMGVSRYIGTLRQFLKAPQAFVKKGRADGMGAEAPRMGVFLVYSNKTRRGTRLN